MGITARAIWNVQIGKLLAGTIVEAELLTRMPLIAVVIDAVRRIMDSRARPAMQTSPTKLDLRSESPDAVVMQFPRWPCG